MDGRDETEVDGQDIMDGTPPDEAEHGLPGTEFVDSLRPSSSRGMLGRMLRTFSDA